MGNADAMSRLPLKGPSKISEKLINFISITGEIPINAAEIRKETAEDEPLQRVIEFIKTDCWPQNFDTNLELQLHKRKSELSYHDGCLFLGNRIIIPHRLRLKILELIHECHIGMVRMKSVARGSVWWLNIDRDIEHYARSCDVCQQTDKKPMLENKV